MYIPIYNKENYHFWKLKNVSFVQPNQDSIKLHKVYKGTNER